MEKTSSNTLKVLSGFTIGFSLFFLTSHPRSRLKRKLPSKAYKNFSLLPNITYHKNNRVYHFHHWLVLSIFYVSLLKSKKFRMSHTLQGLFLGSILQGLMYKDRFKFSYSKGKKRAGFGNNGATL